MFDLLVSPSETGSELEIFVNGLANLTLSDLKGEIRIKSCNGLLCGQLSELYTYLQNNFLGNEESMNIQENLSWFPTGFELGKIVICLCALIIFFGIIFRYMYAVVSPSSRYSILGSESDASTETNDSDNSEDGRWDRQNIDDPTYSPSPNEGQDYPHDELNTFSLAGSRYISFHGKLLVPTLIMTTIGIFISANTSNGATVNFSLSLFEKIFGPIGVMDFSLASTIRDMFKAKTYTLAVLVSVWSGVWPHLKLYILLFCWYTPPKYISKKNRGRILYILDAFGKWAMLDTFLMVMLSVAFKFHLVLVSESFVLVDVTSDSQYGVYAFIAASILSLVMSSTVLAYHRGDIEKRKINNFHHRIKEREQLLQFVFVLPTFSWLKTKKSKTNKFILFALKLTLVAILFLSCFLTVLGAYTKAFSFTFTGITGALIQTVAPEQVVRDYSIIDIADALIDNDHHGSALVGDMVLRIVYLTFAVIMPLLFPIGLIGLCLVPLSIREQQVILHIIETIYAWAALDVFIITIFAAIMEINQFAQWMVGDKCNLVEKLLKEECFGVETKFLPGVWVSASAALILLTISQTIMPMLEESIKQRMCILPLTSNDDHVQVGLHDDTVDDATMYHSLEN